VPKFLVIDEIAEKKLVVAWDYSVPSVGSHFMAYSEHAADIPKVHNFVEWILEKAKLGQNPF